MATLESAVLTDQRETREERATISAGPPDRIALVSDQLKCHGLPVGAEI